LKLYQGYQVNQQAIKYAHKDFIYMHCLPAINGSPSNYANDVKTHFGKQFPYVKNGEIEVAGSVFYSKHAVVYQQAVNRLYAIKAIFAAVIK
jgi:ornithine carbamoyltransferase